MSIKFMAAAWEMDLPQTEKMVLLCLCDFSNDEGVCWPSVATLARKCSVSDRTVQRAIKDLRARGIVSWDDVQGRSHKFAIDPRKLVTPENLSPPKMTTEPPKICHPTPDTVSPKPSITITNPQVSIGAGKPADLDQQTWDDWRRVRKKPITPSVMRRVHLEAEKLGWTVSEAITWAAENSWQGFKADWVKEARNDNGNNTRRSSAASGDGFIRALDRKLAEQSDGSGFRQAASEMGPPGHRLALVDQRTDGAA